MTGRIQRDICATRVTGSLLLRQHRKTLVRHFKRRQLLFPAWRLLTLGVLPHNLEILGSGIHSGPTSDRLTPDNVRPKGERQPRHLSTTNRLYTEASSDIKQDDHLGAGHGRATNLLYLIRACRNYTTNATSVDSRNKSQSRHRLSPSHRTDRQDSDSGAQFITHPSRPNHQSVG